MAHHFREPERRQALLLGVDPYVDDPFLQGVLQCFDQIACAHMSGLLVRSHMNAGQDGFRDRGSRQHCDLDRRPLGRSECPASWID